MGKGGPKTDSPLNCTILYSISTRCNPLFNPASALRRARRNKHPSVDAFIHPSSIATTSMDLDNVDRGTGQYVVPEHNSPASQDAYTRRSGALTSTPRRPKTWACLPCQTRKTKCDGIRPFCSTCSAHKRQCQYKVRGPGTKRYEKSL